MPASLLSLPVELIELIAQYLILSYCAKDLHSLRCTSKKLSDATSMVRRQAFPRPLPHNKSPRIVEYINRCRARNTEILKRIVVVSLTWRLLTEHEALELRHCMRTMPILRLLAVCGDLRTARWLLGHDGSYNIAVDLDVDMLGRNIAMDLDISMLYGGGDPEKNLAMDLMSKSHHLTSLTLRCYANCLQPAFKELEFVRDLIATPSRSLKRLTIDLIGYQAEYYTTSNVEPSPHCLQDLCITGQPLKFPLATYLFDQANTEKLLTLRLSSPIDDQVALLLAGISFPQLRLLEVHANRMSRSSMPAFDSLAESVPKSCVVKMLWL